MIEDQPLPPHPLDCYLFKWIKENVRVGLTTKSERDYGDSYTVCRVSLFAFNPETGTEEQISEDSVTIHESD